MSTTTPNLGLFKYNPTTDSSVPFNIVTALNNNWDILDSNGSSARNIGEIVTSNIPLTDAGLHELDGSLIQGNGIYSAFVNYIKTLYQTRNPQSGGIKGTPITLPTFSSNTQDGITISDARNNTTVLQAIFNGTNQSNQIGAWSTYWISINYGQDTILGSYTIQADNNGNPEYPKAWTVKGSNDGTTWETLDTKTGITFSLNESKTFSVTTANAYKQYRIIFSDGVLSSNNGELKKFAFNAYTPINVLLDDIFATEEEWQYFVTAYDSFGKFVYNSTNNTVRLPKYTTAHGKLIDSYSSGTDWYRIYSDGWCEQGGWVNSGVASVNNGVSVTFLKPYKDINYTITFLSSHGDTTNNGIGVHYGNLYYGCYYNSTKTKNGIKICGAGTWQASGYMDLANVTNLIPQYEYLVMATSVKTAIQVDIDNIVNEWNNRYRYDSNTETLYIGTLA